MPSTVFMRKVCTMCCAQRKEKRQLLNAQCLIHLKVISDSATNSNPYSNLNLNLKLHLNFLRFVLSLSKVFGCRARNSFFFLLRHFNFG